MSARALRRPATCGALLAALAAPAAASERAYVSNERGQSVTVIDVASDAVLATVPVGGRARGIQADPRGGRVFVAVSRPRDAPLTTTEGVLAIDTATDQPAGLAAVGSDPEQFAVGADPARLYVSNEDAGTASVTDLATHAVVASFPVGIEPEGVAISPDGRRVYVTAETSSTVSVIDTGRSALTAAFMVEARPRAAAFRADGRFAFVTSEVGRAVSSVDVEASRVIGVLHFDQPLERPVGVVVAPAGDRIYVATGRANTVAVIDVRDPARPALLAQVAVGSRPWGLALAARGRKLYVANGLTNDVSVLDTSTLAVIATIAAGDGPWGVAVAEPATARAQ